MKWSEGTDERRNNGVKEQRCEAVQTLTCPMKVYICDWLRRSFKFSQMPESFVSVSRIMSSSPTMRRFSTTFFFFCTLLCIVTFNFNFNEVKVKVKVSTSTSTSTSKPIYIWQFAVCRTEAGQKQMLATCTAEE